MDRLNQWLNLIANLGVLFGIGFLAYETRQNTEAIYSQTRATIYSGAQEELWKNMEYPDVTLNLQNTDHELSAEEKIRLDAWLTAALRAREFAWLEYASGNLSQEQWDSERAVIRLLLGSRRTREWWRNIGSTAFHAGFVAVVDESIADQPEGDFVEKVLSIE